MIISSSFLYIVIYIPYIISIDKLMMKRSKAVFNIVLIINKAVLFSQISGYREF